MDRKSRDALAKLETYSRYPTGVGQIERGACGVGAPSPMACMFCTYGHMLECHYPKACDQADCDHYRRLSQGQGEGKVDK